MASHVISSNSCFIFHGHWYFCLIYGNCPHDNLRCSSSQFNDGVEHGVLRQKLNDYETMTLTRSFHLIYLFNYGLLDEVNIPCIVGLALAKAPILCASHLCLQRLVHYRITGKLTCVRTQASLPEWNISNQKCLLCIKSCLIRLLVSLNRDGNTVYLYCCLLDYPSSEYQHFLLNPHSKIEIVYIVYIRSNSGTIPIMGDFLVKSSFEAGWISAVGCRRKQFRCQSCIRNYITNFVNHWLSEFHLKLFIRHPSGCRCCRSRDLCGVIINWDWVWSI